MRYQYFCIGRIVSVVGFRMYNRHMKARVYCDFRGIARAQLTQHHDASPTVFSSAW